MRAAAEHALRSLLRNARAGRLWLLLAALALAVAAVGSVSLFTARIGLALEQQSGDTLGADALLNSRNAIPDALAQKARQSGLKTLAVQQFNSVALAGENSSLVAVRAVDIGYPLRGRVLLRDPAFGPTRQASGTPQAGTVWLDPRAASELQLSVGAPLQLGERSFVVAGLIADEPGRRGFSDLAPRLLMSMADLQPTGLLGPGSRVSHSLQLGGNPDALARFSASELPAGVQLQNPSNARPELKSALDRAGRFLSIAALATALLAAAAVALAARQHGESLRDEIALLKALGARRSFLWQSLSMQLLLLGLLAGAVGCLLALGGQSVIAQLLASLLEIELPATPLLPLASAFVLGLVLLAGFALPPVLAAVATPPTRVFARSETNGKNHWVAVLAAATVAGLLLWQTADVRLAGLTLAGALGTAGALALLAWLMVRALLPLSRSVGSRWRFGLGNVARRRGASVAQVVALGLALLALLLVSVVRQDLLMAWQNKLPADAPNQFLINIQREQVAPLQQFFTEQGYPEPALWPMTRARLTAINGKAINAEQFEDEEARRWVNREFNLSWTKSFGADNALIEGRYWTPAEHGQPLLSVDDTAVKRLGLKLGDALTLDFAGTLHTLTVQSVRKVAWESFKPNFFLVAPPGVLEETPAQWLTSFHQPKDAPQKFLLELTKQFPNVTVIDMDAVMQQVRGIVDKVVRAVEFVFAFSLLAGILVLLTAIQGTRPMRAKETAVLRALGARTASLRWGLLSEYATLGLLAGLVSAAAAQGIAWVLARQVLELDYQFSPMLWVIGTVAGTALVTALGWLSMRSVLKVSPRSVLG